MNDQINKIIAYATNGDERVYEKLTSVSKEKLKEFDKKEIIESIRSFFEGKMIVEDSRGEKKFDYIEVHLIDPKDKLTELAVGFSKENEEWKLQWN